MTSSAAIASRPRAHGTCRSAARRPSSAYGGGTQRPLRVVLHDEKCSVLHSILAPTKRAGVRHRGNRFSSCHRQPNHLHDKKVQTIKKKDVTAIVPAPQQTLDAIKSDLATRRVFSVFDAGVERGHVTLPGKEIEAASEQPNGCVHG